MNLTQWTCRYKFRRCGCNTRPIRDDYHRSHHATTTGNVNLASARTPGWETDSKTQWRRTTRINKWRKCRFELSGRTLCTTFSVWLPIWYWGCHFQIQANYLETAFVRKQALPHYNTTQHALAVSSCKCCRPKPTAHVLMLAAATIPVDRGCWSQQGVNFEADTRHQCLMSVSTSICNSLSPALPTKDAVTWHSGM